ncbi:MAG TPA: hypothetical protein VLS88_06825 [Polyangiales bacterium]|nr:hypothetical protein [Polyangiales bacterium]
MKVSGMLEVLVRMTVFMSMVVVVIVVMVMSMIVVVHERSPDGG